MTSVGELSVELGGRDVGLSDLLRRVDAAMVQSGNNAIRLGQSYARLAVAQNQPALASQVLAGTMQRAGGATEQALIGIQTQASKLSLGTGFIQQFGSSAASSLTSIIGPAALATAALGGIISVGKSFSDAFKFKADLDQTRAGITALLAGVRDSGTVFDQASVFANKYKLTQEEVNKALLASVGILRQSRAGADELLSVLARMQILSPEQGLEGAALAMKELTSGQTTSLVSRFEVSRQAAAQMKAEIEGGADAVAVMNKFLTQSGVGMSALETRTKGAAGALNDLKVANEQLALAQADFAQGPGLVILQGRIQATTGLTRLLSGDFDSMRQSVTNAANAGSFGFQLINAAAGGALQTQAIYQNATNASAAATQALAQATVAATPPMTQMAGAQLAGAQAAAQHAALLQQVSDAELASANSAELLTVQTNAAAEAARLKSQADQVAAIDAQTHAVANAQLALQAQAAAQALLASGGAGAAAAAQLANSSGLVDQLTAAYYRLAAAQAAANQPTGGFQSGGAQGDQIARSIALGNQSKQQREIAAAQSAQTLAIGTGNQKIAEANRLYQQQIRLHGANSVEAINAQTKLIQLQQQGAKAAGGGGGGGGSPKLTAQQKEAAKLAKAQAGFDNQAEDAETRHQQALLDIEEDFHKKQLEAQKKFNLAGLDDRESFYERLGGVEDHGLQQAMSARFEEAALKAQQIAETQGADAGLAYQEAAQQAIEKEGQLQADILKARADHDEGKAEYLEGVLKLQQRADEERLRQIEASGSQVTAEYQRQLDQLEASTDRSIDRIATKAARKGIDLGKGTSTDTAGGSASSGVAASDAASAEAGDNPIVSAVTDGVARIVDALNKVVGAEKDTAGAVRGLSSRIAT